MYFEFQFLRDESSLHHSCASVICMSPGASIAKFNFFFACSHGPAFSDPSEMDGFEFWTDEALFHLSPDGARWVRPRQFDDIARKSAPVFGGARAIHARARLGLYRAFRCCAFVNYINSRRRITSLKTQPSWKQIRSLWYTTVRDSKGPMTI